MITIEAVAKTETIATIEIATAKTLIIMITTTTIITVTITTTTTTTTTTTVEGGSFGPHLFDRSKSF